MGKVLLAALFLVLASGCGSDDSASAPPAPEQPEAPVEQPAPPPAPDAPTFTQLQNNIFIPRCNVCHTPPNASAGLDFSTYAAVRAGVIPGDPDNSELVQKLTPDNPNIVVEMTPSELEDFRAWVTAGALDN